MWWDTKGASYFTTGLDYLQDGLDVAGLAAQGPFEPFGIPIDLTNASISALRGNYGEAALGASAAVPFFGIGANIAKVGDRAMDVVDVVKGGAYKDVKGIAGNEAHHMPANSVSPLSTGEGPACSVCKVDHAETASYGNTREARAYREEQQKLIEQGKFSEAQQMDIRDLQSKFGSKYDDAIQQMLDYTKTLGF